MSSSASASRASSANGNGRTASASASASASRPTTVSASASASSDAHSSTPAPACASSSPSPFAVYASKLGALEEGLASGTLAPHHCVLDTARVVEDVLVHASLVFLEQSSPARVAALSPSLSRLVIQDRLRDAELLSPWSWRDVEEVRRLAQWSMQSSARLVPLASARDVLVRARGIVEQLDGWVRAAEVGVPKGGCPALHAFCRDMTPQHLSVVGGPHDAHRMPTAASKAKSPSNAANGGAAGGGSDEAHVGAVAASTGLANPESRTLRPRPRAHDALPYGWTRAEFEAHCRPLHNTASLELQQMEEEEEEREREEAAARAAERAEKIRLRAEAAERRRLRREAEDAARLAKAAAMGVDGDSLSDLDENPDEVDSEEERLTARRAAARAEAGERGAIVPESLEEEISEDESDDDEDVKAERAARRQALAERRAADAEDEKVANEPLPPAVAPPARFAFTFCCIVCHSVLLRARDIDRIVNNSVWSKPGVSLAAPGKSLVKNYADSGMSRPADERDGAANNGAEEEEEQEAEEEEADSTEPRDEGASKREESIGVHCAGCDYYIGRFFPGRDAFRLVYIHRASGQNFMYFTGDASVSRLTPAIAQLSDEEAERRESEEAAAEEQGVDEDDESYAARMEQRKRDKENAPVTPVVGLPFEYVDERQAAQYPFPRFGSATPYNRPASWQLFRDSLLADSGASEGPDALSPPARELPLSPTGAVSVRPVSGVAGGKASTKCNNKSYRPPVPPVPLIHAQLRRTPDSHYALASEETAGAASVTADLTVLLSTDRVFHNRRAMDALTRRLHSLMANFPCGIYASRQNPPVPLFTHFFLPSGPELTHSRGTARYVFHFLTRKDDGKLKRAPYSYKKFARALTTRWENAVWHLTAGGWGGHRFVLVKVGAAYRLFQSSHGTLRARDRYTLPQWIDSDYAWSRTMDESEVLAFLARFEEARRGRKDVWEQLFCMDRPALDVHDVSDTWQPDQCFYGGAKLLDFAIQL